MGLTCTRLVCRCVPSQAAALEWGALVWHVRWALTPAPGDGAFSLPSLSERQHCERLWADSGIPCGEEGGANGLGSCCAPQGALVDSRLGGVGAATQGWSATAPAVHGAHLCHRLAREASRELVAVLCFRNGAATAAVARMLPDGIAQVYFNPSSSSSHQPPAGGVNLFDAVSTSLPVPPVPEGSAVGTSSSRGAVAACDESMFTSPLARLVYSAAPAAAGGAGSKSPSKKADAPPGVSTSWVSAALWSGDADVPVALGRFGCLWWDAALCCPAANRAQRQAIAARVKVAWFGIVPQARVEHTGPTADFVAAGDGASDVVAVAAPVAAAQPPAPPPATSVARSDSTVLIVQASSMTRLEEGLRLHSHMLFLCRPPRVERSGAVCGGR